MKKALNNVIYDQASLFENQQEDLLTKKELSAKLRYSVSYLNKLMSKKWIPYKKIGRSVRFKYSEVIAALNKRSTA